MKCPIAGQDSLRPEFHNGGRVDIDNVDIGSVELLVVVLLKARAFYTEWMRGLEGRKEISLSWITDAVPNIACPEIIGASVGFGIKKHVFVVSQPVPKSAMVPELLVESLLFCIVILKGVFLIPAEEEAPEAFLTEFI